MPGAVLTDKDKSLVWNLLEQSEAGRHTPQKFLAIVSDALEERQSTGEIDAALRQAIFAFAQGRAEASARLASDAVELGAMEQARNTLKDCAARLAAAPWRATLRERWPATIAHEVERLFEEMQGPRLPSGERLEPSAESALLQLKDAFEVLIKFTATVLMRGLIEAGDGDADWARRQLFKRGLALGGWAGMLREAVTRCGRQTTSFPEPLKALARASSDALLAAANDFPAVRNNVIGHGARALDPTETANLVVGCFATGRVKDLRGGESQITPLATALESMVNNKAYEGIVLEADADGACIALTGADGIETWLADQRHDQGQHNNVIVPVRLRFTENGKTLSLTPFVAARVCTQCQRRDVLLYDSLYEAERMGSFDLLDYARGHKSRITGAQAPDLSDALGDIVPEDAPDLSRESMNVDYVLEALDKARVDRNYFSPAYLRSDLADFLRSHDRGVFWLQAPAHVGKTTFVQGVTEAELRDTPIDPRFNREDGGGKLVAYYCRKEYRTGLAGMISTLQDKLQAAYHVSQNLRTEQPQARPVLDAKTPQAFVRWLAAWRTFAEQKRLTVAGAPLLVAIDGLDEADAPPDSPLRVLPRAEELEEGVYLVLTSRPVGDADAPGFLATDVEALYGRA
jgi:hypothetical protein